MRLQPLILALGVLAASTALACGGDDAPPSQPTAEVTATTAAATATPDSSIELSAGKTIRSTDGSLSIRGSGGTPLKVVISKMTSVPAAPAGWSIQGAAFDITARANERDVTKLDSAIELTFKAPQGQAIVVYHDGTKWIMVESERAADGSLVAKTDHLTPYAVAVPKSGTMPKQAAGYAPPSVTPPSAPAASRTPLAADATRTPIAGTAVSRPSEVPSPERTPGSSNVTPGATLTAVAGGSSTPGGTLTVIAGNVTPGATLTAVAGGTPVVSPTIIAGSPEEAKDALEDEVAKYKGRPAIVTSAASYSATLIGTTTTTVYYGLYGGVNEVVTTGPASSSSFEGSYTFLSEPKTAMPSSSTEAQQQLSAIFPGAAGVKYKTTQESATTYVYTYQDATSVRVIGFMTVNGVPVAFMAVASGDYYFLALETGKAL